VPVVGLDVGGANLKAVHQDGGACLQPFELWKHPERLPGALRDLLRRLPACDALAVTMTGELCDCFATRREGVHAILAAVETAAAGRRVAVWTTQGRFVDLGTAAAEPLAAAAANWLALATFAGRFTGEANALVIDVGSTTTDVVPLANGQPVPQGRADPERLLHRELVYTGARRTPVCALLDGYGAAEWFATTLDVHLVLGHVAEDATDSGTADGRPATRAAAHARLARMLCGDGDTVSGALTFALAMRACRRQVGLIGAAIREVAGRLPGPPTAVVLAGSGEFLARMALDKVGDFADLTVVELANRLGPELSAAACAHAVAVLAVEGRHG
jgi:probable H4MPT-linked C1 transfer pathway protein